MGGRSAVCIIIVSSFHVYHIVLLSLLYHIMYTIKVTYVK